MINGLEDQKDAFSPGISSFVKASGRISMDLSLIDYVYLHHLTHMDWMEWNGGMNGMDGRMEWNRINRFHISALRFCIDREMNGAKCLR